MPYESAPDLSTDIFGHSHNWELWTLHSVQPRTRITPGGYVVAFEKGWQDGDILHLLTEEQPMRAYRNNREVPVTPITDRLVFVSAGPFLGPTLGGWSGGVPFAALSPVEEPHE